MRRCVKKSEQNKVIISKFEKWDNDLFSGDYHSILQSIGYFFRSIRTFLHAHSLK